MTNHAAEIAITGLVIATLKMENPEHILLTWCAISGSLSGYVGSTLFPVRGVKLHSRWIMSVVCAVTCGPILTSYVHTKIPDFSQLQLALVVSGARAVFGVMILKLTSPMIKPILSALLPPALTKILNNDDKKDG
jgi:hypothetical protein